MNEEFEKLNELSILELIKEEEEGQYFEIKASLRYDYEKNSPNKELEYMIARTITAFLNTNEGILLIGVHDKTREILGIEKDYKTLGGKRDRDGFELQLNNVIRKFLQIRYREHIKIKYLREGDKDLCKLIIFKAQEPVYLNRRGAQEFIIRAGNSNQTLSIQEAVEYIGQHWRKPEELPGGINKETELVSWVEKSRERWETSVKERLADEKPSRYSNGIYIVAYSIIDEFQPPKINDLLKIIRLVEVHETGWPAWMVPPMNPSDPSAPYVLENHIECFLAAKGALFQDPGHSDFWRASPNGKAFLLRGYHEDSQKEIKPKTQFYINLPIVRLAECLFHAKRLAKELVGDSSSIIFYVRWEGLAGRTLTSSNHRWNIFPGQISHQDVVKSMKEIKTNQINSNISELVHELTSPLYQVFSFAEVPLDSVRRELSRFYRKNIL